MKTRHAEELDTARSAATLEAAEHAAEIKHLQCELSTAKVFYIAINFIEQLNIESIRERYSNIRSIFKLQMKLKPRPTKRGCMITTE